MQNEKGSALVELTLTLPIILSLAFAIYFVHQKQMARMQGIISARNQEITRIRTGKGASQSDPMFGVPVLDRFWDLLDF